ncbi:unnamed protein product [Urochloa humidicola]
MLSATIRDSEPVPRRSYRLLLANLNRVRAMESSVSNDRASNHQERNEHLACIIVVIHEAHLDLEGTQRNWMSLLSPKKVK